MADASAAVDRIETKPRPTEAPSQSSKPQRRRWWLVPLAAVPLAVGVGLRQLSQSPEAATTAASLPVEVVALTAVDAYTVERQYAGEIVAQRRSALGFEQGGTVVEILVQEGDRISAGQPLARLDSRSLASQRQQLIAQRDQAVATLNELQNGPRQQSVAAAQAAVGDLEQQLALSVAQRDRRTDLYDRGAISREELDQQTFGTGALENRLAQAQSELDELLAGTRPEQIAAQTARIRQLDASIQAVDVDLAKSTITAPFAGRISQRLVDEGVVVSGGQPVVQLSEGNATEARIGIPADVADRLPLGSAQTVTVGEQPFSATVTALLPELESTSRTVTAVLTLNTAEELTLGQTARLVLTNTQPVSGFWLPSTALVQGEQGLWSVYVAAGDRISEATVTRQLVEVLHTEGDQVLVQGLVEAGDRIITSGTHRVVPGQTVSVPD
ncbi:efflux RND transporter periplasmic adaptor subunit [Nodosilinea sp. P-1105]|uniref:efflux RND transporter periplasmic adaptor subunit n=1 Tax=Nodosilinea sp. P-1105 TaxID=2546229 RepID=UPI001469B8AC|nr:efflux RND transporter periplasmic adaptor subunit [Nodosilinea sp. P-1105]NMF86729.1 efflux RND transporter periplasmic adaptor subunit [Nodosilinea sp. P-1105]